MTKKNIINKSKTHFPFATVDRYPPIYLILNRPAEKGDLIRETTLHSQEIRNGYPANIIPWLIRISEYSLYRKYASSGGRGWDGARLALGCL